MGVKEVIIVDPRKEALKEVIAEDKLAKEGLAPEDIDIIKTDEPEEKEESEAEPKPKEDEETEEKTEEKESEEETEEKSEEEIDARKVKTDKLGLKEDATDEDIKTAEEKTQKDAFELEVKELAETENVTLDQARKHLESVDGIVKKYEGNPKKLAAAYRNQQAEFHRVQAENAQLKVAVPKERILTEDEFSVGNRVFNKSKVVDNYRKLHSVETEDLEDAQVFLMARSSFEAEVTKAYAEHERKLSASASVKRSQLIDNLGEGDKKFSKEIQEILAVYDDNAVMQEDFNLKYIASVVKGEKYDELVKTHKETLKAEFERGLKAGREGSRIKIPGGEPPKGKGKASLSEAEKQMAVSMYASLTEEEAYEAFKEVGLKEYREENKK